MKSFSDWLLYNMVKRGWTQAEVAYKIGVDQSTVSSHVRGRRIPHYKTLKKYCDLFGEDDTYTIYELLIQQKRNMT